MRQIILDTETTGLEPQQGHRLIEIGCVELLNRRFSGPNFHRYLNPEREVDAKAQEIHGLSTELLADQPRFAEIADELLEYVAGAELVIHNADFDVGFLNAELSRLGRPPITEFCAGVTDTLHLAKELHPGKRNTLDALCERYGVDNSNRTLHGALLDAELLAEVFLAFTRGQESLVIEAVETRRDARSAATMLPARRGRVLQPSPDELAAHAEYLLRLDQASKGGCLWVKLSGAGPA